MIEVVPFSVGVTARSWDDQHLELAAASRQIDAAGADGFTTSVAAVATAFTDAWSRLAGDLGVECVARADRLRAVVADYVDSDEATFVDLLTLSRFVSGVR